MAIPVLAANAGERPSGPEGAEPQPERPALAAGVEVVGEAQGTAFRDARWLIQRRGRFIQVSEPLYRVAEYANGERTAGEIATLVSRSTGLVVTAAQVRQMLARHLVPLAVVEATDPHAADAAVTARIPASPLLVNMRLRVLKPSFIDPVARALRFLFSPVLLMPLLALVGGFHWWLYGTHGLSAPIRDVVYTPGALLGVVGLYLTAGVFHEFGHAAALRYGGGRARAIGIGIYLIYPVFYTDTTDSYRLGRWSRVRTDLGGFYFHLLFALAILLSYVISGHEWLLLVVLLIDFDIARQLFPFVRFDGYWALTDLLGVPDILSHMKSTLARGVEPRRDGSRAPTLEPWARAVFGMYTLVTFPLLGALAVLMLLRGPLMLVYVWNAVLIAADQLHRAWVGAQVWMGVAAVAGLVLLGIQAVGIVFLLLMLVWQPLRASWRWSGPRRVRRAGTVLAGGAAIGLLLYYWISTLAPVYGGTISGLQTFGVTARTHVQGPVAYPQSPPVAGPHSPIWQSCGFYSAAITNESAVHSMEHGAVWITFRPDLPASQVAALRILAREQSYVLVSPYPDLPAPVVASAWNRQVRLTSADDPRLDQFVRLFRQGPQAPESGRPCAGGVGTPER